MLGHFAHIARIFDFEFFFVIISGYTRKKYPCHILQISLAFRMHNVPKWSDTL